MDLESLASLFWGLSMFTTVVGLFWILTLWFWLTYKKTILALELNADKPIEDQESIAKIVLNVMINRLPDLIKQLIGVRNTDPNLLFDENGNVELKEFPLIEEEEE